MVIPQNLNLELPWNYLNFTSAYMYNTKEIKRYTLVHRNIIHNNQKVEVTQMAINRWTEKQ